MASCTSRTVRTVGSSTSAASTCNATTTTGCSATPTTVTVGHDPVALTVDGGAGDLYVANAGSGGGITVVSLSTQAVVTTIATSQTGNGTGLVQSIGLSPDGNEVLAVLNGLSFPGDVMATINTVDQVDHCNRRRSRPARTRWASS